ncbi:MAG: 23S rRNA (adenine(2503)-C(2))-methyltransferase RlmN [Thermoleophilia bacterium]|nr:23S rRNA (adenine(2503)-C(2))-methyltransferase RlmN [Thermoleophilia bacterium]
MAATDPKRHQVDLDLLKNTLADLGEPEYRAGQVWEWTARGVAGYDEMTNLPAKLREALAERVPFSALTLVDQAQSRDGTVKALFHTHDDRPVEAVLMRFSDGRRSICVSSQSGCPLTCTFCATGTMAFGRNLTAAEIVDQALFFRRIEAIDHCVFMGMGEPMMNLDNVLAACDLLPDVGITHRRTTVSTVGWMPGLEQFNAQDRPIRLALSLHAADPELRSRLMPVNERYPLADVLGACRKHWRETNRKVFVEYVMLGGVNDHTKHARQLAAALKPHTAFKVNLIPYNPTGTGFDGSGRTTISAFRDVLLAAGVPATVRLTRGRDIAAACGQLAADQATAQPA